jgi:hypothetical protein
MVGSRIALLCTTNYDAIEHITLSLRVLLVSLSTIPFSLNMRISTNNQSGKILPHQQQQPTININQYPQQITHTTSNTANKQTTHNNNKQTTTHHQHTPTSTTNNIQPAATPHTNTQLQPTNQHQQTKNQPNHTTNKQHQQTIPPSATPSPTPKPSPTHTNNKNN